MKQHSFYSHFADHILHFIEYKNNLGYPYEDSIRVLWNFDTFCCENYPEKSELDQEIGMKWLEKKDTEAASAHRNRIMVIREFARYLWSIGETAYLIPISLTKKSARYVPHIFTQHELAEFFRAADHFEPHEKSPARHLVVPVFYRLLYCCGLRPSEGRLLLTKNVDLEHGVLKIVESKGHKDRLVPMADDLTRLMRNYHEKVSAIFPDSPYFFPRYDGNGPYTKLWTEEMFWKCFEMAGVTEFEGAKPRVYDFRHTFATNCLYRWIREGKDADTMLPYLSAYMGHAMPNDTAYYIHLVPNVFDQIEKIDISSYEALLPEVPYED